MVSSMRDETDVELLRVLAKMGHVRHLRFNAIIRLGSAIVSSACSHYAKRLFQFDFEKHLF